MTAADALQAAVNLLTQAREASDDGYSQLALILATEAQTWATIALAIEAGTPAPDYPDRQPAPFPPAG